LPFDLFYEALILIDVQSLQHHHQPGRDHRVHAAMRDTAGNLPPLPGIFPDYMAPVVRNVPDGVRELAMLRWGMPGPPAFGGAPITNIRNTKSPHCADDEASTI
jgi:putative SOS response-associated peptidase YedK